MCAKTTSLLNNQLYKSLKYCSFFDILKIIIKGSSYNTCPHPVSFFFVQVLIHSVHANLFCRAIYVLYVFNIM